MRSALALDEEADSVDTWLERSHAGDPKLRREAVHRLCPCQLKADYPEVWQRLLAMVHDEDAKVRAQVLHSLGDGSPRRREAEVVAAVEAMRDDPDPSLRRRVRHLLAQYRRTGRINVL